MYLLPRNRPLAAPDQPLMFPAPDGDETASSGNTDPEWLIRKTMQAEPMQGCELLFRRYYSALCSHAVRVVYSRTLAEDLVADVFCDFWAYRMFEQVETSYRAYLFRMVRNRSLNYLQRDLKKHSGELLPEAYPENAAAHPEQQVAVEELFQAIEQTVQHLPPQCRRVFLLSRYEGKRTQEIADQMQISPRTVETHISKALHTLRQTLQKMGLISLLLWMIG